MQLRGPPCDRCVHVQIDGAVPVRSVGPVELSPYDPQVPRSLHNPAASGLQAPLRVDMLMPLRRELLQSTHF